MTESFENGYRALLDGALFEDCPYNPLTQAASREQWEDGWVKGYSNVKHGG